MKKGLALQTTIMLVLVTVSFIILLPIISELVIYGKNYVQGGTCQASAALSSFRADSIGTACIDIVESPVSMSCDRRHIIIGTKQSLVVQGSKEKILTVFSSAQDRSYKKYENLDSTVVQSIFAEELRLCWEQFGEGGAPLLDTAEVNRISLYEEELTGCFICSDITFSEKLPLQTDFSAYLRLNNTPGGKETYFDYLNNENTLCEAPYKSNCWPELEKHFIETNRLTQFTNINSTKQHAVVYVRKGFQLCQKTIQKEHAELSNFVYVLPVEDIPRLCDAMVI